MNMKVRYIQPADNAAGFEEITVSAQEAVRLQREYVSKVRPEFVYVDDEQALADYITVHWAWIVTE